MQLTKKRFVLLWLCSAAVVVLARVLNSGQLGELPIQIQAGQHLLAGNGLTVYASPGEEDLARPARLVRLAHYPTGYSLYAAGLMSVGLSVATVVKLFFAISTMIGWWGWGNLAYAFFGDGLRRGRVWSLAAVIIAVCTPLLYTMLWKGTDTFLWAAIPWVFIWVTNPSSDDDPQRRPFDLLAGFLCGLAILMRYAAIFLAIYTLAVILIQSATRPRILAARVAIFGTGLFLFVLPQIYLNLALNTEAIPDIFTLHGGVAAMLGRVARGLPFLASVNIAVAWWMPHQLLKLITQTGPRAIWLIALTVAGWASLLPLMAWKLGYRGPNAASRDVRMVATGWFVAMPIFLLAWTGVADYIYVVEDRYYFVLLPLLVFFAYQLATPIPNKGSLLQSWTGAAGLVYMAAYVVVSMISTVRLLLPGEFGTNSRIRLMALPVQQFHWPSTKIDYDFSPGRAYIIDELKKNPGTVLVTNHEEWFSAEPEIDQTRVRRLKDLRASYISGPARILIAIQDHAPGTLTDVAWFGHYNLRWTAEYFRNLRDVRLLRTFPSEKIRVVEARVPAGERIPLAKDTAQVKEM